MISRISFAILGCILLSSCSDLVQDMKSGLNGSQGNYLSGLGAKAGVQTEIPPEAALGQGFWDVPAGTTGERVLIVDTKHQKVQYFIGSTLVGESPMSSGKEGHSTPAGNYKIYMKDANYKSGTYGVLKRRGTNEKVPGDFNARAQSVPAGCYFDPAPMPYALFFAPGYAMHVGFVAGYPVSHGCVRLPADMAKKFFENTPVGTTCIVK